MTGRRAVSGTGRLRVLVAGAQLSPHSGTTKVAIELVRGLTHLGCDVDTHFLAQSKDVGLLGDTGFSARSQGVKTRITGLLSAGLQLPLIQTVWNHGFTPEDSVDLLGAVTEREFLEKARWAELVIFMNFWSAIPIFRIEPRLRPCTVVYFHELPRFTEVPPLLRFAMRGIVRWVAHSCTTVISVSDRIREEVQEQLGRDSIVLYHGIRTQNSLREKSDFILLDTRWTGARQPGFAIALAGLLPELKFVMAGYFPSAEVKLTLQREIGERGLRDRIEISEGLTEERLNELYGAARFYVRWSAGQEEAGPSVGVFQAIGNLCPPIVDRQLGATDFLRRVGLGKLVVERDPSAFAERIRELGKRSEAYGSLLDELATAREQSGWDAYCLRLLAAASPRSPP